MLLSSLVRDAISATVCRLGVHSLRVIAFWIALDRPCLCSCRFCGEIFMCPAKKSRCFVGPGLVFNEQGRVSLGDASLDRFIRHSFPLVRYKDEFFGSMASQILQGYQRSLDSK